MTTPTTVQVRLQIRADTAANWTSFSPVLLANELGLETDTKKFKIGDGNTSWQSLAYFPSIVSGGTVLGNLEIGTTGTLTFEGSTANGFETTLGVVDPTADRTILLPNQSGTVVVGGNASIVDADIAANAEIAVSKLADGAARQLLQTDAAGTGVEWTSNIDIPGTLDVTGAATFDGAVTVAGDLTVNGTTTTISTQNLLVEDKNIILGDVATPTDVTADGGGITLKGTTDKTINWVDATDAWTLSEHVNIASGKEYRIGGTKVLDATSLGSSVLITSANITDGTIVNADVNASAAIAGTKISPDFGSQNVTTTGTNTAASFIPTSSTVPTNGVYLPATNSVAISTGGTGRLFVSQNRTGVNINPTAFQLQVNENSGAASYVHITNSDTGTTGSDGALIGLDSDEHLIVWNQEAKDLRLATSGQERLRITSAGLVGVGTSSPSYPFHVANGALGITSFSNSIDGASEVGLLLRGQSGSHNTSLLFSSSNTNVRTRQYFNVADGSLRWDTSSDGTTFNSRLYLSTAGNVGIGTTSPGSTLTVAGNNGITNLNVIGRALFSSGPNWNYAGYTLKRTLSNTSIAKQISFLLDGDTDEDTTLTNYLNIWGTYSGTPTTGSTSTGLNAVMNLGAPSGVALHTNGSERARIDSSGRLLVGTSSARASFNNTTHSALFQVEGASASGGATGRFVSHIFGSSANADPFYIFARHRSDSVGGTTVVASGDRLGTVSFQGSDGTEFVPAVEIVAEVDGTPGANDMPGRLVFSTTSDGASSPTERMRINSEGRIFVNSTSTVFTPTCTQGAGTSFSLIVGKHSATNGSQDTGTTSFIVYTNGNVVNTNNSYGAISDAKLKENIVDATSQWSDIKALQVRKYNFKEGQTHTQIGLVAQEVELVSPGLVTESPDRDDEGNDLGTVTKSVNYSVLYMKAVKALQEAMERIETLEAKVAALESA